MLSRLTICGIPCLFFVKQKTAYELRISDWSSDVCSSDLHVGAYGVSVFRAGAALFILMGLAGCTGLVPSAGQRGAPPPQRASGTAPAARPVPAKPMDALPAARPTNDISTARGLGDRKSTRLNSSH